MKLDILLNAVNAGVAQTSQAIELGDLTGFAVHVKFSSATLAGTLVLQASIIDADWVDVASSSQAVTAGESHIWNVNDANYPRVRVKWTQSAGAGTITAQSVTKDTIVKPR